LCVNAFCDDWERAMKKRIYVIILVIVFLTGVSLLLYPTVSDYISARQQAKAIAHYVEAMESRDTDVYKEHKRKAMEYNASLPHNPARFSPTEEELMEYYDIFGGTDEPLGYIEIDAIDTSLPIYVGTEESVLQVGAGTMPGSSVPIGGESTHAVITGHRGLPSSKLLTDLDRLKEGDTFVVNALGEALTYEIDHICVVLPHEMEELAIHEGKDECTIVTCTPYGINTHRLLVRGRRIADIENTELHITADAVRMDKMLVIPIAALPIIILAVIFIVRRKESL